MKAIALALAIQCLTVLYASSDALTETITIFDRSQVTFRIPDRWTFTPIRDTQTGITWSFSLRDPVGEISLTVMFGPDLMNRRALKSALAEEVRDILKSLLLQLEYASNKPSPRSEADIEKEANLNVTCFDTANGFGCQSTLTLPESEMQQSETHQYRTLISGTRSFPADGLILSYQLSVNHHDSPEFEQALDFVKSEMQLTARATLPVPATGHETITLFDGRTVSFALPERWTYTPMRHPDSGIIVNFSLQDPDGMIRLAVVFTPDRTDRLSSKSAVEEDMRSDFKRLVEIASAKSPFPMTVGDPIAERRAAAIRNETKLEFICFDTTNGFGCHSTFTLPESEAERQSITRNYHLFTCGRRSFHAEGWIMSFEIESDSTASAAYQEAINFVRSAMPVNR